MSINETAEILSVLRISYPNAYNKLSDSDKEALVSLWSKLFADIPYKDVSEAVCEYINNEDSNFPPSPGKLNKIIRSRSGNTVPSAQEALQPIRKAVQNSLYHSEEEFAKLSPTLKRLVGSPNQLKSWATCSENEFETVITSRLAKSYNAITENEFLLASAPASVEALVSETQQRLTEGGFDNEGAL